MQVVDMGSPPPTQEKQKVSDDPNSVEALGGGPRTGGLWLAIRAITDFLLNGTS